MPSPPLATSSLLSRPRLLLSVCIIPLFTKLLSVVGADFHSHPHQEHPAGETVTKIEASLLTVGQSVNSLLPGLLTLANSPTSALSQKQIAAVPQLVSDYQAILASVQSVGKTVVGGLPQSKRRPTPVL